MINEGDARFHMGMSAEVINQRSRHDTLKAEEIRTGRAAKTKPVRVVVVSERRLRESLTAEQERAFDAIAKAWRIVTRGLGVRAIDYSGAKGVSTGSNETEALLMARYRGWWKTCQQLKKSPRFCVEVCAVGLTLRQVEDKCHFRHGTGMKILTDALDEW